MEYFDYDKISDILFYFSNRITLNFNVILSRADQQGNRRFFHYEVEYGSKYIGRDKNYSIKRNIHYYFSIEDKDNFDNGLILRPQDIQILKMLVDNKVLPWYFDAKKRVFKIIGDRLTLNGKYEPALYSQSNTKLLMFEPFVFEYEDSTFKEGIRITINREYVDIDIDKFMGLYNILFCTDMYSVACTLTNYVKTEPYGISMYKPVGLGSSLNSVNDSIYNDTIPKKSGSSFLDSINRKVKGDNYEIGKRNKKE